jgi:predicted permease
MKFIRRLVSMASWILHRDRAERRLDDEVRSFVEMATADKVRQGVPAGEARRLAVIELGGVERVKECVRAGRHGALLDDLGRDVRIAFRLFARQRTFTTVAVLTLALGIGANAAIFSAVHGVLLRPLPFSHPEQLVRIWSVYTGEAASARGATGAVDAAHGPVSPVDLDDWQAACARDGNGPIARLGGYWYAPGQSGTDLTGQGEPTRVAATFVTPGFFTTLGVAPALGRVPRDEEMVRGANDKVVVLSDGFWRRQFGAAAGVVNSRINLGGQAYEVVGVMPPTFRFPAPHVDVFIPHSTIPDDSIPRTRAVRVLDVVGRLRSGASAEQAHASVRGIAVRLAEAHREDRSWSDVTVAPLHEATVGSVRTSLLVLLAAVGFVLLTACINLAGLLLARASARERELAIRAALGAGRARLVRQLLTESLILALAGGVLGLWVARLGMEALLALAAGQLPRAHDVRLDATVVLWTAGLSLFTGLAFGLIPAVRATSVRIQEGLREGSRSATSGASARLRDALVVGEVALAAVLVAGATFMARNFVELLRTDLGFQVDHRVAIDFVISGGRQRTSPEMQAFYRDVLGRVRALPGVIAAGGIKDLRFRGNGEPWGVVPEGMAVTSPADAVTIRVLHATDGYFRAMGVPVLAGRELSPDDREGRPPVFVVNQALARHCFPGLQAADVVGRTLEIGGRRKILIVGLVGDISQTAVDEPAQPTAYVSVFQNLRVKVNLVVHTLQEPAEMARRIKETIWALDGGQTISAVFTLEDSLGEAVARPRLVTVLLGVFGAVGLILGALGIYGVLAYLVARRGREIGVRMALGARTRDVLGLVVGRGLALAGAGVVLGIAGALVLMRFMRGILYNVAPTDPVALALVAGVLLIAAGLASWLPARRAARVDPSVALRAE